MRLTHIFVITLIYQVNKHLNANMKPSDRHLTEADHANIVGTIVPKWKWRKGEREKERTRGIKGQRRETDGDVAPGEG